MPLFRVERTHKRGKKLATPELVHNKVEAENETQAVVKCLQRWPVYGKDTLRATPRKG